MTAIHAIPEQAIRCYEAWSGLNVCVHDLDGGRLAAVLHPSRAFHCPGPCIAVKQTVLTDRCYAFEVTDLRPQAYRWPEGRIHRCHAGMVEWMMPILDGRRPLVILFAGQRQAGADLTPDPDARQQDAPARQLPPCSGEQAALLLEGLRQLAARLRLWLEDRRPGPTDQPQSRAHQIQTFIARHHTAALTLGDLAQALHLSKDRAAHAVREATGRSWTELLIETRLRSATELLRSSDAPITSVALASGFNDLAHFHRVFKRHLGISPGRYRRDREPGT